MRVNVVWKGSLETQDGAEKVTVGVPAGQDDELHAIKKKVKSGASLVLMVVEEVGIEPKPNLTTINSLILDTIEKEVQRRLQDGTGGLFKEKNEGRKDGTGAEGIAPAGDSGIELEPCGTATPNNSSGIPTEDHSGV